MHLYMGLKKEKKIGFDGGIGVWGRSVGRENRQYIFYIMYVLENIRVPH